MVPVLLLGAVALVIGGRAAWRRWLVRRPDPPLAVDEIDRLRRAELSLASAPSTEAAAHELCKHAMVLLDAPAAAVIIEGVGDTVRREAGDSSRYSVYEAGSRMRLLASDGVPCGSIAVAARPDRPYTERDERVLDALGERVSSTLHRIALFETVQAEQRTLADVLGSSSDGIFSVGADRRVRSWNPAMAKLTGTSEVVAIGESCCTVFKPRDENGDPLFGASCPGRTGDVVEVLVQLPAADDNVIWL